MLRDNEEPSSAVGTLVRPVERTTATAPSQQEGSDAVSDSFPTFTAPKERLASDCARTRGRAKLKPATAFLGRVNGWVSALLKEDLSDNRRGERLANPPLVAYYWTGGAPEPCQIANISSSGLYFHTNQRWYPGTRITMTLQRTDHKLSPGSWIAVECMIVRLGDDGVGGAFIPKKKSLMETARAGNAASKVALRNFVRRLAVPAERRASFAQPV